LNVYCISDDLDKSFKSASFVIISDHISHLNCFINQFPKSDFGSVTEKLNFKSSSRDCSYFICHCIPEALSQVTKKTLSKLVSVFPSLLIYNQTKAWSKKTFAGLKTGPVNIGFDKSSSVYHCNSPKSFNALASKTTVFPQFGIVFSVIFTVLVIFTAGIFCTGTCFTSPFKSVPSAVNLTL
jgi:hypothetical protein